jgi:hypothetical protein
MRRVVPFAVLTLAIASFFVGGLVATQLAAPAAAKETLTVIEHATTDTILDLGDDGDSIGDTLAFSNELYDADNANVVGSDQGSCVRTKPGEAWECTFTNILPNGSIVVQGPYYDAKDSVLAITGGTGDYSGAEGQMQLKSREGGEEIEFTFEID